MSLLRRFGSFWWDFVVGDEWRIAIIVAVATGLGALAAIDGHVDGQVIACAMAVGTMLAVCAVIVAAGRGARE